MKKQAAKKAPAKKATKTAAAPKKAPKTATKKAATKAAPAPAPESKAAGLRKPQVRILEALAKSKAPLTRREIADAAPCDFAGCTEWLGSQDPETRAKNDAKHFPSLLTLGYIAAAEGDGGVTYTITPAGRAVVKGGK